MATSANPPPGAIPANASGDPFVGPPAGPLRYASFDTDHFSLYSSSSPSHARRALEAHLKDTDRRIQDASRLGTTLLQQRKELSARLKDVEQVQQDNEVPDDLRKKLAELEKEYNEVGKESARAFLPKSRPEVGATPTVLTGLARESPTKVSAPSRRQRNQPSNRVHDIEFAAEISTSLLAQVRQLQAALAEKDDALKDVASAKAQLEAEAAGMMQRIKQMDESEQRYKDENWNLETKLQDLEAGHRDVTDKHDRLNQTLKATQSEKAAAQRELDDLRVSHEKLSEDHAVVKKQQESDLHGLRRDVAFHQTERQTLQKKIEELTGQNTELAKAVSYRWNQSSQATDSEFVSAAEDRGEGDTTPEHSEPPSPVKGTPRHGMLESETLKSSLNHAHRMIQNLKNNIHREKTEKIELKRMLQDARDELETRRGEGGAGANVAKKRQAEPASGKFKKPARPDRLGANRNSTTEILEDEPDWEDHDGENTPSKSRAALFPGAAALGAAGTPSFDHAAFGATDPESTDAFETANERDLTTETEAFETGNEELGGEDSDLTETEEGLHRSGTVRAARPSPLVTAKAGDRRSFLSTASASDDDDEQIRTPVQAQQPKYRLRMSRGANRRSGRVGDLMADSPGNHSPTSSNGTPQAAGQSLGDELDAMDDDSVGGTPGRMSEDLAASPETERQGSVEPETFGTPEDDAEGVEGHEPEISSPIASPRSPQPEGEKAVLAHQANAAMLAHEHASKKANYVDTGMMTEPWEPEKAAVEPKQTLRDRAGEMVGGALGGALAGFGLGRIARGTESGEQEDEAGAGAQEVHDPSAQTARELPAAAEIPGNGASGLAEVRTADKERPESVHNDEGVAVSHPSAPVTEPKSLKEAVSVPLLAAKAAQQTSREAPIDAPLQQSTIIAQETEPVSPPRPLNVAKQPEAVGSSSGLQRIPDAAARPEVPLAAAAPLAMRAEEQLPTREMGFSSIAAQEYEPVLLETPRTPMVPKHSSRRMDALYNDDEPRNVDAQEDFGSGIIPGTEAARPGAGFFAGGVPSPLVRSGSKSMPASKVETTLRSVKSDRSITEPKVFGGVRETSSGIPTLVFGDDSDSDPEAQTRTPLGDVPAERVQGGSVLSQESAIPVTKPLQVKKPMADGGSQTVVSGDEIEDMMRNKSRTSSMATSMTDTGVSPIKPATPTRRSVDGIAMVEPLPPRGPRRPASAGSMRTKNGFAMPPPLPEEYKQKITAAVQKAPGTPAAAGTMGPPLMPASAYKQSRAKTPTDRAHERSQSRDGTTPRPVRHRDSRSQMLGATGPSGMSRRTSVSSFASELDERFNITRGDLIYPSDVIPATDPRMIQAITQTMIGEYLWKYTRKAGRSETSSTRHRRFFWVHPYTRTLYWSEQDPSTAGRNMLKAKSVAIQSVRVITDDNTYPPGLHRKSIVVVTPGREIVFTAPTGQRHETWFNALSYLLLRTEREKGEAEDGFDQQDIEEFNPGFSIRRSISRMTGGDRSHSRQSMSSYNSRTTRTSSPQRREAGGNLTQRQSSAALRSKAVTTPTPAPDPPAAAPASRSSTMRDSGSVSGRFSSLTSKFRPSSSQRGSFSTTRDRTSYSLRGRNNTGDPAEIYDASVVADSAEDLRAVIERQETDADRLENVRACCDGKHDVGSLSNKKGRHSSMGSRFGGGHSHSSHTHTHAHPPKAEPIKDSLRPRRGE
ncbi:hypothetical protein LTR36_001792 [Oleoguttula mirabilis]|uniref:PH domain-containing protein n=1 Tax=Oleoguttula mirabilis TaxID=1507867 RepID=A0AAV9JM23_9PEZI|nr:hypothetical protein LTR36_001792 [Oleoguttula mirabilis]